MATESDRCPLEKEPPTMDFQPVPPTISVPPQRIADDTWVVQQIQEALGAPLCVNINSMVIRGAEPVLVDTGTVGNRDQWLAETFALVDPADVRYVFISHDDIDHTGNLAEVMTLCPNATLLASWALHERHSNAFHFPLDRTRWVNDGDHLDLSDRRLEFVRPPVYDSPTTRGVFDHTTRVYWAADSFATPCTPAVEPTVAELDPEFWADGVAMFGYHALSPWLATVDPDRYAATVDRVRDLDATTIASGHSPVITQTNVDDALELIRALPLVTAPPLPDQHVLDAIVSHAPAPAA
jgi:flavorubredoxin